MTVAKIQSRTANLTISSLISTRQTTRPFLIRQPVVIEAINKHVCSQKRFKNYYRSLTDTEIKNNRNNNRQNTSFRARLPAIAPSEQLFRRPKKLMIRIIQADVNDSIIYGRASSIIPFFSHCRL